MAVESRRMGKAKRRVGTMTEYERVIEEIAKELYCTKPDGTQVWGDLPSYLQEYWCGMCKRLLSSLKHPNGNPMVYLGAEDQRDPEIPTFIYDCEEHRALQRQGAIVYSKLLTDFRRILGEKG